MKVRKKRVQSYSFPKHAAKRSCSKPRSERPGERDSAGAASLAGGRYVGRGGDGAARGVSEGQSAGERPGTHIRPV